MSEGIINQLIDPKVLSDFDALVTKMEASSKATLDWIEELGKIETKFNSVAGSFKDWIELTDRMTKAQAGLNVENEKRFKIEGEQYKMMQGVVSKQKEVLDSTQKITQAQERQAKVINEATAARKEESVAISLAKQKMDELQGQYETTIENVRKYEAQLESLKKQYDNLGEVAKKGARGDELKLQISDLKDQISILNKERVNLYKSIEKEVKYNDLAEGSMEKMGETLGRLRAEYRSLSEEENP